MSRRLLGGGELEGFILVWSKGSSEGPGEPPLLVDSPRSTIEPPWLPVLEARHGRCDRWGIDRVLRETERFLSLQRMTQQDHLVSLSLVLEPLKLTPPRLKISSTASRASIASN